MCRLRTWQTTSLLRGTCFWSRKRNPAGAAGVLPGDFLPAKHVTHTCKSPLLSPFDSGDFTNLTPSLPSWLTERPSCSRVVLFFFFSAFKYSLCESEHLKSLEWRACLSSSRSASRMSGSGSGKCTSGEESCGQPDQLLRLEERAVRSTALNSQRQKYEFYDVLNILTFL